MRLVRFALGRPVTIIVAVLAIALFAALAVRRMAVDIFPDLGAPVVYISQPYGGMDPSQMEGYITYYYEYHLLYVTGIEHVESRNVQGAALIKCVFHPGTDMSRALSEVVSYVNRSRSFMPPGAVPPFVTRFDAGSVSVGQLVFSSPVRSVGELQDFALNRVRPLFATLEGVSAPPPFGGNQRTIVVRLNPDRLRQYRISPEEAIKAVNTASAVMPSGNIRTGELNRLATTNAGLGGNLPELLDAPVRSTAPAVYLRDIATVESGTDIVTGYAHVNGKRTVYMPVTKRSDASTVRVLERVRAALPAMGKVVPEDVSVTLEFDQSGYVTSALKSLVQEGLLGALLTALVVIVFLRDWRGALVVVSTIPAALLAAVVWLWALGQTINIMTLSGLALAVGVLVDEATVEIENIHSHLAGGLARPRAVLDACRKTAIPRLLSMLAILAVFAPSFFMTGVARQLFVPLSLAVGLAMMSSYFLSSTLVPVMSVWFLRRGHDSAEGLLTRAYSAWLKLALKLRWPLAGVYTLAVAGLLYLLVPQMGLNLFPVSESGPLQVRLRAPEGTRVERTERIALDALRLIEREAGGLTISTSFVGQHPASYPVSNIHLFTSGPHEAVIKFAPKPDAALRGEALRERLRAAMKQEMPQVGVSFEPGDIVGQVMSFGSFAPIEVAMQGPNLAANREFAAKVKTQLEAIGELRDLQYAQSADYPTLNVTIDRERAGQFGLSMAQVAKSIVAGTSSSRFIDPNFWRDPVSGNAFQIQVEIPQHRMQTSADLLNLPVGGALLSDVAQVSEGRTMGLVERYNMQRVISLGANLHGIDLGAGLRLVRAAIARAGTPPRGVAVQVRGQAPALEQTLDGLRTGLLLALAAMFVLLAAYFQSVRVALAVFSTMPAVLAGSLLALLALGQTLNIQSYLGLIMAVGISVANAILFCSFAESARREGQGSVEAAAGAGRGRRRAITMTALAMIAGMVPLAFGEQSGPLAIAVIGGLAAATVATLTILPAAYSILLRGSARSVSLDPDDPESRYFEGERA